MSAWMDRNRHLYPENWEEIAHRVKDEANWTCAVCDAPHGPIPTILTVHHIDHDPGNCADENLVAVCQRCHLKWQGLRPRPATKEIGIARLRGILAKAVHQLPLVEEVEAAS